MGHFHEAVSSLIGSFTHGLKIIDTQQGRRTKQKQALDSASKEAELQLQKSLKRNRTDVKSAYGRDLKRCGDGFAHGDEDSRSALAAILFRLNAGFVSVIERFTKGRSSAHDYQVLLNLSNASRVEAIKTFEQLSTRLSSSSLSLVLAKPTQRGPRAKKSSSSVGQTSRRSAPKASTPLGPATPDGWVRPKGHRKKSSDSSKPTKSPIVSSRPTTRSKARQPVANVHLTHKLPRESSILEANKTEPTNVDKRESIMSFASDSTKLGEIPVYKWARFAVEGAESFPTRTCYPLEQYQEPEKQKSRFLRLFRRD